MKKSIITTILVSLMMAMPSQMSAQEENGYTKFSVREDFTDNAFQWFRDAKLTN